MKAELIALLQVVLIDVTLAGDNAVVVGMAVAGLRADLQRKAIVAGIVAATLIRVVLSLVAIRLLAILGLTLAGGVLLLWVCWKMFRELRAQGDEDADGHRPQKTLKAAIWQIMVADLSMSLDNVLAVAGAAREHIWVMVAGLGLSVVLMAVAASLLARLLEKHRWIAWQGLLIVLYVAVQMIFKGWHEVLPTVEGWWPAIEAWFRTALPAGS